MFEQKIKMVIGARKTREAFGISQERGAEVIRKLIAVAQLYPVYSVILESFLNCTDRFTTMERLWGVFELGKIHGAAKMMKSAKILVKFDAHTMPLEGKLLSILSKNVEVSDPTLEKIIHGGKRG